jgi:hypothetical protein
MIRFTGTYLQLQSISTAYTQAWLPICDSLYFPKVKVKVTFRLTVSQSISLGVGYHLGLMTGYLLLFNSYGLVSVGCPLWREIQSVFCICCCSFQCSLSRVRVPWDSRYFTVLDLRLPVSSPPTTRRVMVEVFGAVAYFEFETFYKTPENLTGNTASKRSILLFENELCRKPVTARFSKCL